MSSSSIANLIKARAPARRALLAAAAALVVAGTIGTSSAVAGATGTSSAVAGATGTSSSVAGATGTSSAVAGATGTSSAVAGAAGTSSAVAGTAGTSSAEAGAAGTPRGPAGGLQIGSAVSCGPAVEADAEAAREAAAHWYRHGGGAEARLCEAAALEALGAHATAAALLTRLAENPNRVLARDLRATILADAARLWVSAGRPETALAALASAASLGRPDAGAHLTSARAAAALGDWTEARDALDRVLAKAPDHSLARALRAATLREAGEPDAALAEARSALEAEPDLAEARFEEAAALAELGRTEAAVAAFLTLAADAPEHDLAPLARSNARRLAGLD